MLCRKAVIAVDLDGTVSNTVQEMIRLYNQDNGTKYRYSQCTYWEWPKEVGLLSYFHKAAKTAKPLWKAVEAVERLNENFDVFILTARGHDHAKRTENWCRTFLPFIDRKRIVLLYEKYMFKADLLIDDSPRQLQYWRGAKVCFKQPWNKKVKSCRRMRWDEIVEFVESVYLERYNCEDNFSG